MEGSAEQPHEAPRRQYSAEELARAREVALEMIEAAKNDGITGIGEGKRRAFSGAASEPFRPIQTPED